MPRIAPLGDCGSSPCVDRVRATPTATLRARTSKMPSMRLGAGHVLCSFKWHIQPMPFRYPSERCFCVASGTKYSSAGIAILSHQAPSFVKREMLGKSRTAHKINELTIGSLA